ncbi:MAG: hypothetical protein IOC82_03255 [Aestuariivirga sp.]|uniref:hypothetical protein n=1 Tax=Aestuariivirga sp. TaxID=2650926 RepID=UPI0025C117BE|nr:hypothetical protein [Aestuariivirga sp.]MCA3560032.1 hypothetical protein [Aestuariivirga sp.]
MSQSLPEESFTLVSPGYRPQAGRLAFAIGAQLVAEMDDDDLAQSWQAADELTAGEAAELSDAAALHLMELLEEGLPAADLSEAVADAAVVFLIAMKRHGIADPKRIPACAVMWNLRAERASVHIAS